MNIKVKAGRSLLALMLVGVAAILSSSTMAVNFSGKWALNAEKSDFGGGGGGGGNGGGGGGGGRGGRMGGNLTIVQDAKTITISRTRNGQNGEVTTTEKITLDGKESSNEVAGFGGNTNTVKSTATWSADGKSLVINSTSEFNFQGNSGERKSTATYSLSGDGKELTVMNKQSGFNGGPDRESKLVYDKQ